MIDAKDIARKVEAVQELLTLKFGIKRQPLAKMLSRAERRLSKRMQGKIKTLIDAQQLAGHPKLARQLDSAAVSTAYADVTTHLKKIDVADRRRGKILGLAGVVVFNLLLVVAGFVMWMWWRGYV
jgi:hypothetical protein